MGVSRRGRGDRGIVRESSFCEKSCQEKSLDNTFISKQSYRDIFNDKIITFLYANCRNMFIITR